MKMIFITLFPEIIEHYTQQSIFARAVREKKVETQTVNIRDFAEGAYKRCDDSPYGGGSGMILLPTVLDKAICSVKTDKSHIVFPTPVAPLFTQDKAQDLSLCDEIIFICGRYEGIDERIIDMHVDTLCSIGGYVISSGELSSLVVADCVYRLLDGTITQSSLHEESYQNNLLEYPHYTRPAVFKEQEVPLELLSGNHQKIKEWRHEQQIARTKKYRPDLL